MTAAQPVRAQHSLGAGIYALSGGMLWLQTTRSLVAADVHLGYEEIIGGALPLWSTAPSVAALLETAIALEAREIILLGDVIHGTVLSEGARRRIGDALSTLRARTRVELIAGNHEGKSRGAPVLGETKEQLVRDDWLLLHGDRPSLAGRVIIGHLHPSLHLGGDLSVPVFLESKRLIVLPALTPYSHGLDVRSEACARTLATWNLGTKDVQVLATSPGGLFALGRLAALRADLSASRGSSRHRFSRTLLQPDR